MSNEKFSEIKLNNEYSYPLDAKLTGENLALVQEVLAFLKGIPPFSARQLLQYLRQENSMTTPIFQALFKFLSFSDIEGSCKYSYDDTRGCPLPNECDSYFTNIQFSKPSKGENKKSEGGHMTIGIGFLLDPDSNARKQVIATIDKRIEYEKLATEECQPKDGLTDSQIKLLFWLTLSAKGLPEFESSCLVQQLIDKLKQCDLEDMPMKPWQLLALQSLVFNSPTLLGPGLCERVKETLKTGNDISPLMEIIECSNGFSPPGTGEQDRRLKEAGLFHGNPSDVALTIRQYEIIKLKNHGYKIRLIGGIPQPSPAGDYQQEYVGPNFLPPPIEGSSCDGDKTYFGSNGKDTFSGVTNANVVFAGSGDDTIKFTTTKSSKREDFIYLAGNAGTDIYSFSGPYLEQDVIIYDSDHLGLVMHNGLIIQGIFGQWRPLEIGNMEYDVSAGKDEDGSYLSIYWSGSSGRIHIRDWKPGQFGLVERKDRMIYEAFHQPDRSYQPEIISAAATLNGEVGVFSIQFNKSMPCPQKDKYNITALTYKITLDHVELKKEITTISGVVPSYSERDSDFARVIPVGIGALQAFVSLHCVVMNPLCGPCGHIDEPPCPPQIAYLFSSNFDNPGSLSREYSCDSRCDNCIGDYVEQTGGNSYQYKYQAHIPKYFKYSLVVGKAGNSFITLENSYNDKYNWIDRDSWINVTMRTPLSQTLSRFSLDCDAPYNQKSYTALLLPSAATRYGDTIIMYACKTKKEMWWRKDYIFSVYLGTGGLPAALSEDTKQLINQVALETYVPNESLSTVYIPEKSHPIFASGAWDRNIEHDVDTGKPIFTYRVFDENNVEIGFAEFYAHPLLCFSEDRQRHNVISTAGILSRYNITDQMSVEEVCEALPPTLFDRALISAGNAAVHGALRGGANVVGFTLESFGVVSKEVAYYLNQSVYYSGFFVLRFSVYCQQMQEYNNLSGYFNAMYAAAIETGQLFIANVVLNSVGTLLEKAGESLEANNWSLLGKVFKKGGHAIARFGIFVYQAADRGIVPATASLVAGTAANLAVEEPGKYIVSSMRSI